MSELHPYSFSDAALDWQAPTGLGVVPPPCLGAAPSAQGSGAAADGERRRLRRLLGGGLLEPPAGGISVSRAFRRAELLEAYRLVHDAFVEEGLLEANPRRLRVRPYELVPDTATFIAKSAGRVIGVMSAVPDSSDLGLPSDRVFGAELEPLRRAGRKLVEISNLAVAPDFRRTSAFLELSRAVTAHLIEHGFDDVFVAVSPKHVLYFQRILRFEPWGTLRSYRTDAHDPVEGLRLDAHGFERALHAVDALLGDTSPLHSWFFDDNPFRGQARENQRRAERRFLADDVPKYLMGDTRAWLSSQGEAERVALLRRWHRRQRPAQAPAAAERRARDPADP
jgi:hypothetical protein